MRTHTSRARRAPAWFPCEPPATTYATRNAPEAPAQEALALDDDAASEAASAGEVPEWTEADIVQLHYRLVSDELRRLPDPETPLEEKLDTLAWIFTDRDDGPFSFASCLRVVGCSPLSPMAYFGKVDADDIRDWLRPKVRQWLRATLERYPDWVRALIREQPDYVCAELARNPQWINEQMRRRSDTAQPDLFGMLH